MSEDIENTDISYYVDATPELLGKVDKLGEFLTPETFVGSIDGFWSMHQPGSRNPRRASQYYRVTGFRGDVIFFDRSWVVVGDADYSVNGRPGVEPYSVEYTYQTDELRIDFGAFTFNVANVSSPNSPVQLRYDIANRKVIFIVRSRFAATTPGNTFMEKSSYLKIE
ncbi:hypothetical protein Q8A57_02400 [Porticoccus litoralis]|uniref:DUF1579 domain-containing protein n=1 Tax=Porticoccus litoralis TaxID=434086 RepID=A0AAW8AYV2_9GAMM|nr:hypothetical protein [Porticoccus litoralis]MDP1519812.1 hypothetical protein [Porticoccus litoralis]